VFRSNTNIYAQIIDDNLEKTLVAASTRDKDVRGDVPNGGNCTAAEKVGELIAKKSLQAGISKVAFDRHGFKYHGRVKALADAARRAGLDIGAAGEEKAPKEAGKSKSEKAKSGDGGKSKAAKENKSPVKPAAGKSGAKKK
jgi:large subunit ribosomal protein L18